VTGVGAGAVDGSSARIAATAMISGLSVALLEWARSEQAAPDDAVHRALDVLGGASGA